MKKIFIISFLFFSNCSNENTCYALPIVENNTRIIEWGNLKYSKYQIPTKKTDHMRFEVKAGTDVKSFSKGKVILIENNNSLFGRTITIKHKSKLISFYGHLNEILVEKDQQISCGEIIGKSGISGRTSAPNLYFKVMNDSTSINPRILIK